MDTFFKTFLRIFLPGMGLCALLMIFSIMGGDGNLLGIAVIYLGIFTVLTAFAAGLIAAIVERTDKRDPL